MSRGNHSAVTVFVMAMSLLELIRKKRDGAELSEVEMMSFVDHVAKGSAQECQIGAMLMAMYIRGLSESETFHMTRALKQSGDSLTWPSEWRDLLVDKHSTGGVGDKTSLPLVPIVAACGLKVPMLSGRGLEFTGGTLDKLESIPGFSVQLSPEQMKKALQEAGCFIAGHTAQLAPADRVLYSRRDMTATVDSDPLTIASIVSKKTAEGIGALVMDIKIGRAALFTEETTARDLAKNFISIAEKVGLHTRVALSHMNDPLGCAVGNSLEVAETVEYLRGGLIPDLHELVSVLAGELLLMKKLVTSLDEGISRVTEVIKSGRALLHFEAMLRCQGVSAEAAHELCHGDIWTVLPHVPLNCITRLQSPQEGFVADINALEIGLVCKEFGAGRNRVDQEIDHRVGVSVLLKPGDVIRKGEEWLEVHHPEPHLADSLRVRLDSALVVAARPVKICPRVIGFV